jgi:crotonobetainyl-CoA:carnitine CoA-transferase CaiB-like acyl-CoA transferase
MNSATPRSLEGIRILDLSRILAAPSMTQLLGDLGADVVKVERPGTGDDTRSWGPPYVSDRQGADTDLSGYFLCANRNKRSIAVDLACPAGADLIKLLAAKADVVVENYKPGDLARKGLDYEALRQIKPDLIWCSVTGFGQTGPYAGRAGYDFLVQAMGGIMSITGAPEAEGGEPMKTGVGVADLMCGMYAGVGILAALRHRDLTGEGQFIDLSLFDTQIAWLTYAATNYLLSGKRPQRLGNRHPNITPYQPFRAADGILCVAVGNDRQFAAFCRALGAPELAEDARFRTNPERVAHRAALEAMLAPIIARGSVSELTEALLAVGVPAGPLLGVDEALHNEQTQSRAMVIEMEDEAAGERLRLVGNPLRMSVTPPAYRQPPPHLNANRDSVLRDWLAATAPEIADLEQRGAFGPSPAETG